MTFPRTYFMNIVGIPAWLTLYASLMLNGIYKTNDGTDTAIIITLSVFTAIMVGTLSLTAFVLKKSNKQRLSLLAEAVNYSLLLAFLIQLLWIFKFYSSPSYKFSDDARLLFLCGFGIELFCFVAPSIMNIRALNVVKKD